MRGRLIAEGEDFFLLPFSQALSARLLGIDKTFAADECFPGDFLVSSSRSPLSSAGDR